MGIDPQDAVIAWLLRVNPDDNLVLARPEIDPAQRNRAVAERHALTRVRVGQQVRAVRMDRGMTRSDDRAEHGAKSGAVRIDLDEAQGLTVDVEIH